MKKIFVGIFLFSLLASCSLFTRKAAEKPIATAYGKDLYLSQILEIFPDGISKEDSVQFLKNYTESWVKKQVTLNKAEANLTVSQKNVDQLLDDYRTSLLIYKYEEKFIQQKLDTVVTNQEVTDFYNSNKSNLILMVDKDTAMAVNICESQNLSLYFAQSKIRQITFRAKPESRIVPIDKLDKTDAQLKGFVWKDTMPATEKRSRSSRISRALFSRRHAHTRFL